VLFVTGYGGTLLSSGVEVISKPFKLDVLARRVEARLDTASWTSVREPGA
jgi:hypothetical protein